MDLKRRMVVGLALVLVTLSSPSCSNNPKTVTLGMAGPDTQAGGAGNAGAMGAANPGSGGNAGTGGSTGFGQNVPRDQFCSRAPGSGIAVPDPRASGAGVGGTTDPDAALVCTGDLAKRTFRFGLCTCQDLVAGGTLTTDSFHSTTGAMSRDGSVGVRTRMTATTLSNIGGSLWVAGLDGAQQPILQIGGSNIVAGELHVGGDVDGASFLEVGADAYVSGSVGAAVFAGVSGVLYIPSASAVGGATAKGGVQEGSVSVADPCNCDRPLDIGAIVRAFENANDNAASGIGRDALIAPAGTNLKLDCGRYYFEGASIGARTTIHLTGRTAIFIAGDFEATSILDLRLDPGAELDLLITGNVTLNGASDFGYKNAPARIRMYVSGTSVNLVSLATLGANIYARNATVNANGTLSVWGSMYADRVLLTTLADFHYDSAVLETEGCEPPDMTCDDCHVCSGGSCISGTCAPCRNSADCCAPLACRQGECVPLMSVD